MAFRVLDGGEIFCDAEKRSFFAQMRGGKEVFLPSILSIHESYCISSILNVVVITLPAGAGLIVCACEAFASHTGNRVLEVLLSTS